MMRRDGAEWWGRVGSALMKPCGRAGWRLRPDDGVVIGASGGLDRGGRIGPVELGLWCWTGGIEIRWCRYQMMSGFIKM